MTARDPKGGETSSALARLTQEARDDVRAHAPSTRDDETWAALDEKLFAQIDREESVVASATHFRGSRSAWGVLAGVTAVAAALLVFVGRPVPEVASEAQPMAAVRAPIGSSTLARQEGSGSVIVNAQSAARGRELVAGDTIEAHGGRAVFVQRLATTWALEPATRVTVERTASPLVLTLERGAVEAQVAPVERGEAFAVDIDGIRVAVHGTHLRVERMGDRVVVDLTEGVISVGAAPLRGSTYGSLVTAPAHVEFLASDARATLRVDHTPGLVRTAISLPIEGSIESASPLPATPPAPASVMSAQLRVATTPPVSSPPPSRAPASPSVEPAPPPEEPAAAASAPTPAPPAPPAPTAAASAAPQAKPGPTSVTAIVHACWEAHAPPRGDVGVTVRTTLTVDSNEEGAVRSARFSPPLPPEVQTCASEGIYKTHFAGASRSVIPIELSR